jgi:hypothetical protein
VAALELDRMTWPEVHAAQQAGRDLLVVAFGAIDAADGSPDRA